MKQIDSTVSKVAVRTNVRECEECQSEGALNVEEKWHCVAMDITHYKSTHFLICLTVAPLGLPSDNVSIGRTQQV